MGRRVLGVERRNSTCQQPAPASSIPLRPPTHPLRFFLSQELLQLALSHCLVPRAMALLPSAMSALPFTSTISSAARALPPRQWARLLEATPRIADALTLLRLALAMRHGASPSNPLPESQQYPVDGPAGEVQAALCAARLEVRSPYSAPTLQSSQSFAP